MVVRGSRAQWDLFIRLLSSAACLHLLLCTGLAWPGAQGSWACQPRPEEDVAVLIWPRATATIDPAAIKKEIRALRVLARTSIHVSTVLNSCVADVAFSMGMNPPADYCCVVYEHSEFGYLDRFLAQYSKLYPSGLSVTDMQVGVYPSGMLHTSPISISIFIVCHTCSMKCCGLSARKSI